MSPDEVTARDIGEVILNRSMDGIFVFDEDMNILLWNPGMEKMTRVAAKEAVRKKITDVFPGFKKSGEIKFFKNALSGAEALLVDRGFSAKPSGKSGYFDASIAPAGKEKKTGVVIMHDITQTRQKKAEQEKSLKKISKLTLNLQNSMEKLAAVFKSAAMPILIYSREKYVTSANDEAIRSYGFNPVGMRQDEVIKRVFTDPKTGKKIDSKGLSSSMALEGKTVKDRPYYMFDKYGKKRYVNVNTAPIYFKGKVDGAVVAWLDITSQKKTEYAREELLREVEKISFDNEKRAREFEIIVSSINEPILIYDEEGVVYKSNKAAEEFYGFSPEGLPRRELLDRVGFKYIRDSSFEKEKGRRLYEADAPGGKKMLSVTFAPLIIDKKKRGEIVLWHDVTGFKDREKSLVNGHKVLRGEVDKGYEKLDRANRMLKKKAREHREISELWEKVFSNTQFLTAYLDRDFNFISVNRAYAEADGKKESFFPGKNHFDLYPNNESRDVFMKVRETGKPYFAYSKQFGPAKNKGKTAKYWDWSIQPVKGENKRPEGFIFVLIDVTKRKEAEQQLEKVKENMEKSKRLSDMGALSANIAHELRNPLGVIKTAVYNIKRKVKDGSIDRNVKNIEKKINESTQIINNLLNFTRINKPTPENIRIYDFIKETVSEGSRRFADKGVKFEVKISSLKKRRVQADPYQLREIINNLVNNAAQAADGNDGKVVISSKITKYGVFEFKVEDNGPGIEDDVLKRAFEPFYTTRSKGTGLGLAICNELARLHSGRVKLKRNRKKGTSAAVYFPAKGA